jgi:hypothetical protein
VTGGGGHTLPRNCHIYFNLAEAYHTACWLSIEDPDCWCLETSCQHDSFHE